MRSYEEILDSCERLNRALARVYKESNLPKEHKFEEAVQAAVVIPGRFLAEAHTAAIIQIAELQDELDLARKATTNDKS